MSRCWPPDADAGQYLHTDTAAAARFDRLLPGVTAATIDVD